MNLQRLAALCAVTGALLCTTGVSRAASAELTPFLIQQTETPRFPAGLIFEGITHGDVWVLVSIDETGKLSDALVTRYTQRALADEAMYVLGKWSYEPARHDGRPIASCGKLHFRFEANGAVISLTPMGTAMARAAFAHPAEEVAAVCRANELDRDPTPIRTVTPYTPVHATGGSAVIEFIIDEQGLPRMPVLVSSTGAEFSQQAVLALAQWQFTPPTRHGQPVSVPARQEFLFPARS